MANKSNPITTYTVTPSGLKEALMHTVERLVPVFVWGPPGIGKSQIARQVADHLGFDHFKDIRLSQMEPTDLRGIPVPAVDNGMNIAEWSPPSFYKRDTQSGENKAFYLFDEMNSAPQSIQSAAYQWVLDRAVGEHSLGPKDFVMAAGNRDTDKGSTFKMPVPLQNRFVHLELRPSFDDWQTHALEKMFEQTVVGFLTFSKDKLFQFDPTSASRGFPTPRSWERVSDLLKGTPNVSNDVLEALVAGAVGDGVAAEFMSYRRNAASLPNPSDILSGKVTELKNREVSLMYTLTASMCYELKNNWTEVERNGKKNDEVREWHKQSDNFFGFMLENFMPELVVMGARTALALHRLPLEPTKMKNWETFSNRFKDLILQA